MQLQQLYKHCATHKRLGLDKEGFVYICTGWRLGVVISVVGCINEVNQHRARLVHDG